MKFKNTMFPLALALVAMLRLVAFAADQQGAYEPPALYPPQDKLIASPGNTTYYVDPVRGNDAWTGKAKNQPWKTLARVNGLKLAAGDRVIIEPGVHRVSLKPSGAGTAAKPVVIQFLPGVHELAAEEALRRAYFVASSSDDPEKNNPIGFLFDRVAHFRIEGGGSRHSVRDGSETAPSQRGALSSGKTEILYGGRMIEILCDRVEDVSFTGLVFDLKRPTISEFRVQEVQPNSAVIQIAEGSTYAIENGKFQWTGDWGAGGLGLQEAIPAEGKAWRRAEWNGFATAEKIEDLGNRKVRLTWKEGNEGLVVGHQFQFRLTARDCVGVNVVHSKDFVLRDCDFYALTGMGFVCQFTENIVFQRVNVIPRPGTIRTCPAWADVFHCMNCKGDILVDTCRVSGMQDDALSFGGLYMGLIEKLAPNKVLVRFMHPQSFGYPAYAAGDEVAVINHSSLREYDKNPRRKVVAIQERTKRDWEVTFDGPVPSFGEGDVMENITWDPRLTARNNYVDMDPVRGFLINVRSKTLVEGNTFVNCKDPAILSEPEADFWYGGATIHDMEIRNNKFIHCGIQFNPHAKGEEPAFENIRITGNYFEDCGVTAKNVKSLSITGNRFSSPTLPVQTSACSDVKTEPNRLGAKE
jgi:hypothetical protein